MEVRRRWTRHILLLGVLAILGGLATACDRPAPAEEPRLMLVRTFPQRQMLDPNATLACMNDTALHLVAVLRRPNGETERVAAAEWELPPGEAVGWFNQSAGVLHVKKSGVHVIRVCAGQQFASVAIDAAERLPLPTAAHDLEVLLVSPCSETSVEQGAQRRWAAQIANWGPRSLPVRCVWRLDGQPIDEGVHEIPPTLRAPTTIEIVPPLSGGRHVLTAHVQSDLPVRERILKNNAVSVVTDARPIGLWVERSVWDWHRRRQPGLPVGDASSFAGWARRQVNYWNDQLTLATDDSEAGPQVRLDRVVVVPDDALGLQGGEPGRLACGAFDLAFCWGFPTGPEVDEHYWSLEAARAAIIAGEIGDAPAYLDLPLLRVWHDTIGFTDAIANPFPPADAQEADAL